MRAGETFLVRPFERDSFSRTLSVLASAVSDGVAPSFSAGAQWRGDPDVVWVGGAGAAYDIFDISSVSKLFTASLAALLVDRGWLRFDLPVAAVFPRPNFRGMTLSHLLSHQAGFVAHRKFYETLASRFSPHDLFDVSLADRQAAMRELILAEPPEAAPGERVLYTDIGFLLLGFILEDVTGSSLDRAITDLILKPMGLKNTFYHRIRRAASKDANLRVAPTEESVWRGGLLQGQVHDDNCWAMGGYGGHAGLFSSVQDLLLFSSHLWSGFLSRDVLRKMWTRTTPHGERTLGWDTPSPKSMLGTRFSRNTVGHWGFTGTSLWLDLEKGLSVTLLSNRVHPSRDNLKIREFRPVFHDTIRDDFERLGV